MNQKQRVNRPMIKLEAKAAYSKNWQVLLFSALIISAIQLILNILKNHFLPQLTITIPMEIMNDYDAFVAWAENFWKTYPQRWDMISGIIAILLNLLSLIILTPLSFGFFEICSKVVNHEQTNLNNMFYWCTSLKKILRSIGLTIIIGIYTALWSVLFMLPGIALYLCAFLLPNLSLSAFFALLLCGTALILFGAFATAARTVSYITARCLLASDPDLGIRGALKECRKISKGRHMEYFVLCLSFILWLVASNLTYGIVGLYATPYFYMTTMLFIRDVKNPHVTPPDMHIPLHMPWEQ